MSHLAEQVEVVAADRQHLRAALQVDVGRFVVAARDMADRPQIDHDRSVHLRELRGIELYHQLLQRDADQRLSLAGIVAPGNQGVLRVGTQVVDVVDRDQAQGLSDLRTQRSGAGAAPICSCVS